MNALHNLVVQGKVLYLVGCWRYCSSAVHRAHIM
jgi:hypothetical protein